MSNLLIFSLIVIFGLIPLGFGIVYGLYRKTIVFPVAMIVFNASMFCAIVAYAVSEYGFISLTWAIPLCIFALVSSNFIFKRLIQRPLKNIESNLNDISKGILKNEIDDKVLLFKNELGDVAQRLKTTIESLQQAEKFAKEITKGNFSAEYALLSDYDDLGHALMEMRDSLVVAAEKEKERKIKEDQNNYITTGVAQFSEILRQHSNNLKKLSYNLISELVDYIGAVQGAIFFINDENPDDVYYEMLSAIAYEREKVLESEFRVGEGLVGRCAYELLPIHLKEIPDNYINITSGLGASNPRNILLVPAIMENKVYAVIEIASLEKIETYQIDLIEKIGENIASTFANVRRAERTNILLEKSKQQQEEMANAEEELRQNIEELQATQEEMERKEEQLKQVSAELKAQEEIIKSQIDQLKTN